LIELKDICIASTIKAPQSNRLHAAIFCLLGRWFVSKAGNNVSKTDIPDAREKAIAWLSNKN
jgi:hypothetical protein